MLRTQTRRRPWRVLLVLFGLLVSAKWVLSALIWIPVTWGDSYLYLSRARNLARLALPVIDNLCGPAYPPLYSFLLSPAYLVGSNPESSYQAALMIGALLGSTILFPAFLLHRHLTGKTDSSVAIAALIGGLSVSVGYGLTVMAENLFLPLFAWFCLLVVRYRRPDIRQAVGLGLLLSCLILTKSLARAILPGVLLLVAGTIGESGERRRVPLAVAATAMALAIPLLGWSWWDAAAQAARPLPQAGSYPSSAYLDEFLSILVEPRSLILAAQMALAQLAYLFVSTFGLAGAAAMGVLGTVSNSTLRLLGERLGTVPKVLGTIPKLEGSPVACLALTTIAVGLVGAGTLHGLVYHELNPERYGLFGRYVDALIPICVVLGAAVLQTERRARLKTAAGMAVMSIASILILPTNPPVWLHRTGLYHTVHLKQWLPWPLVIALTAGGLSVFVLGFRRRRVRWLALLYCGLLAGLGSAEVAASIRGASRGLYREHAILAYIREHFTRRDRLVFFRNEYEQWSCFSPLHWMLMYQTEALPVLASRAADLPSLEPGGNFYFVSRDYRVVGRQAVAGFRQFSLYRCNPAELIVEPVLSPDAEPPGRTTAGE